jgi:very-short-patch-repair endonuclease
MLPYDKNLKAHSRALRSNMTDAEQTLWQCLRRKQINGWQFYRQKPLGPYIVDFYCAAARLVVEIDGSQHFEAAHQLADRQRDAYLQGLGLRVLRFDNRQVLLQTDAVLEVIRRIPPNPPFSKGGVSPEAPDTTGRILDNKVTTQTAGNEHPVAPATSFEKPQPPNKSSQPVPPFAKGGLGGINLHAASENGDES